MSVSKHANSNTSRSTLTHPNEHESAHELPQNGAPCQEDANTAKHQRMNVADRFKDRLVSFQSSGNDEPWVDENIQSACRAHASDSTSAHWSVSGAAFRETRLVRGSHPSRDTKSNWS